MNIFGETKNATTMETVGRAKDVGFRDPLRV